MAKAVNQKGETASCKTKKAMRPLKNKSWSVTVVIVGCLHDLIVLDTNRKNVSLSMAKQRNSGQGVCEQGCGFSKR